jgi:hypothetical protein
MLQNPQPKPADECSIILNFEVVGPLTLEGDAAPLWLTPEGRFDFSAQQMRYICCQKLVISDDVLEQMYNTPLKMSHTSAHLLICP